jgi:purine-nucleoside phosphorylase
MDVAQTIELEACVQYSQLPLFPRSTAAGHKGCVVCGTMDGVPVAALVGRSHLYEGYCAEQLSLPVQLVHALGTRTLILTNAAGGLNPRFRRGDVMLIRNHLCFQNLRLPDILAIESATNNSILLPISAYDDSLIESTIAWSRGAGNVLQQGVYVAVIGPNYETRAEYRMFRNLGGDAVGMSTAIEATVAARLGIRTLGLSMIANVALPDCPKRVTHEEVLAAGELARPVIEGIVRSIVRPLA